MGILQTYSLQCSAAEPLIQCGRTMRYAFGPAGVTSTLAEGHAAGLVGCSGWLGGLSPYYFQNCHHFRPGGFGAASGVSINSHPEQSVRFTTRIDFWQWEHDFEVYHKPTTSL